MSDNCKMEIKGNNLIVTINLKEELGVSKSEKSINIATTHGAMDVPGKESEKIKIGINCYKPNPNKDK